MIANNDISSLLIGILVPSVVILFLIILCFYIRYRNLNQSFRYEKVNHSLDDEEIEFKSRMIDGAVRDDDDHDDIEDLFAANTDYNDEDVDFSLDDIDRLTMLEKFKSNLEDNSDSNVMKVWKDGNILYFWLFCYHL